MPNPLRVKMVLPFFILMASLLAFTNVDASSRIKDIASFEGIRDNHLIGYGLVVGLDGTGDSLRNAVFTKQSLEAMLEQLGVNTRGENLNTKNVAAVLVTAELPAFSAQGTRIDINVSTLGDAKSLLGGQLLVTPLRGADGEVYAVAQGAVTIGGLSVSGDGGSVKTTVATTGRIPNGAIIEREIEFDLNTQDSLRISLHNPDLTTAKRVAAAINKAIGPGSAEVLDTTNVALVKPGNYIGSMVNLITDVEQLSVTPDMMARVVINENSGTIVMSDTVRVSTVAIAQGSLTITISENPQVSQPEAFSEGETETVPNTTITIDDGKDKRFAVLKEAVTLQMLVDGLNALGIGPRDMITILQSIKRAGALHADLIVH